MTDLSKINDTHVMMDVVPLQLIRLRVWIKTTQVNKDLQIQAIYIYS